MYYDCLELVLLGKLDIGHTLNQDFPPGLWKGLGASGIKLTEASRQNNVAAVAAVEAARQCFGLEPTGDEIQCVFCGTLVDDSGLTRLSSGCLSSSQILTMNYFLENVIIHPTLLWPGGTDTSLPVCPPGHRYEIILSDAPVPLITTQCDPCEPGQFLPESRELST
eukprot:gene11801-10212_t